MPNATPLFEQLGKTKAFSSKQQLWLFDTLSTKKNLAKWHGFIQLVSFNACISISYLNVWLFIFNAMLFMEHQYSMFHRMSNRDEYRTFQWNSLGSGFHLKIDAFFIHV